MPSRNILKQDVAESYYHVYARGESKHAIFRDETDYFFFIGLFERYLSANKVSTTWGSYPHLYGDVELLAYCLMPNHFHLLLYQTEPRSMTRLMQGVLTSYSRHFNSKYERSGPMFESRYKASRIDSDTYLQHISRYIHLNPRYWRRYPYSSLGYYIDKPTPHWLTTNKILDLFSTPTAYSDFVTDYEANKLVLDEIKDELANQ